MSAILNLPDIRPSLLLDFANSRTLDPRVSCIRATEATVNDFAKLRTVPANVPRTAYNPNAGHCLGLLVEPSAINKSLNSDDASLWQNTSSVIANNEIAPDGTLTADTILNPLDSGTQNMQFVTLEDGVTETFSRYLCKRSTAQWVRLRVSMNAQASASIFIDIKNKAIGTKNPEFTGAMFEDLGDWLRFSVQYTPPANQGGSRTYCYNPVAADGSPDPAIDKTLIVWRSQIEVGTKATSAIKTTGSQATRFTDSIYMALDDWFNPDEGTLVVEYELSKMTSNAAVVEINSLDTPTANKISMRYASGGHAQFLVAIDGVNQVSVAPSGVNVPGRYCRSMSYKSGEFMQAINGNVSAPQAGNIVPPLDNLRIGSEGNGSNMLNDTIRRIAYYPRAFTAAQHQRVTTL